MHPVTLDSYRPSAIAIRASLYQPVTITKFTLIKRLSLSANLDPQVITSNTTQAYLLSINMIISRNDHKIVLAF